METRHGTRALGTSQTPTQSGKLSPLALTRPKETSSCGREAYPWERCLKRRAASPSLAPSSQTGAVSLFLQLFPSPVRKGVVLKVDDALYKSSL